MTLQQAKLDLLVLDAQQGCESAFTALYQQFNGQLLRFCFRFCGDEQLAKDAVQESWITLSRNLKRLEDPRKFRVWAFKTVRWRVVDLVRRRGAQPEALSEDMEETAAPAQGELATSGQLKAHLDALPKMERVCLSLFYLEDMKITEIAAVMEVPVGTVKSRLNRARERLRQNMIGDSDDKP